MTISTPPDMEIRKTKLSSQNKLHTNVGCVRPSAYTVLRFDSDGTQPLHSLSLKIEHLSGLPLVVQWLGICLAMHRTRASSLVREPRSHMRQGNQAPVPQLESVCWKLESTHSGVPPQPERPMHLNRRSRRLQLRPDAAKTG